MLFTHKGKKFHQDILSYNNGEIFYQFYSSFIDVIVGIFLFSSWSKCMHRLLSIMTNDVCYKSESAKRSEIYIMVRLLWLKTTLFPSSAHACMFWFVSFNIYSLMLLFRTLYVSSHSSHKNKRKTLVPLSKKLTEHVISFIFMFLFTCSVNHLVIVYVFLFDWWCFYKSVQNGIFYSLIYHYMLSP
jgi:hypothetical protein